MSDKVHGESHHADELGQDEELAQALGLLDPVRQDPNY